MGATSDVARGTNGTLRADYTGADISIEEPTLLRFFNTSAFAVPATGTFGSAARNTIVGPGMQQVDASVTRDVRLSGNHVISIQLQATNVFNTVRFAAIDSVVNSPTFGQVVSICPDAHRAARREIQILMCPREKGSDPFTVWLLAVGIAATSLFGSAPGAQTRSPVFRSDVNLVVVDVVVRDRAGAIVRGLTPADFDVREDDRPQQVTSFDVEEVTTAPQSRPLPQC